MPILWLLCIDGTGGDEGDGDEPGKRPNHIRRLADMGAEISCPGHEVRTLYFRGVGAGRGRGWLRRGLEAVLGVGQSRYVEAAYRQLARSYRPGDKIAAVGYSRGAEVLVRLLWWAWREGLGEVPGPAVDVCWVGFLDRVSAQYLPDIYLIDEPDPELPPWPDLRGIHLVARDEDRQDFEPSLFEDERIRELWLMGSHTDAGGSPGVDTINGDLYLEHLIRSSSQSGIDIPRPEGHEVNGWGGKVHREPWPRWRRKRRHWRPVDGADVEIWGARDWLEERRQAELDGMEVAG